MYVSIRPVKKKDNGALISQNPGEAKQQKVLCWSSFLNLQ